MQDELRRLRCCAKDMAWRARSGCSTRLKIPRPSLIAESKYVVLGRRRTGLLLGRNETSEVREGGPLPSIEAKACCFGECLKPVQGHEVRVKSDLADHQSAIGLQHPAQF